MKGGLSMWGAEKEISNSKYGEVLTAYGGAYSLASDVGGGAWSRDKRDAVGVEGTEVTCSD